MPTLMISFLVIGGSAYVHVGVDFIGPGFDASLQIVKVVELMLLFQLLDGSGAALAASAMNDHRFIAGDLIRFKQTVAQGNHLCVQIGFFDFDISAHRHPLERFVSVDHMLQFFSSYFFYEELISIFANITKTY